MRNAYTYFWKTKRLKLLIWLLLPALVGVYSCRDAFYDYYEAEGDVAGRIIAQLETQPELSTFVEGLALADLDETVGNSGLYTVFAPTNDAFNEFFQSNGYTNGFDDILAQPNGDSLVTSLMNYHVVLPMIFAYALEDGRYPTRARKYLDVVNENGGVLDGGVTRIGGNNGQIISTMFDIEALNGAIHAVDRVLVPDPSLDESLTAESDLSISDRFFKSFDYLDFDPNEVDDFDGDGVLDTIFTRVSYLEMPLFEEEDLITLYAPTNDAWEAFFSQPNSRFTSIEEIEDQLTITAEDSLNPDVFLEKIKNFQLLTLIAENHIAEGINNTGAIETSAGETVDISGDMVVGTIEETDISNGRLHKVNEVVSPPSLQTVAGNIWLDPEMSFLLQALFQANLLTDYLDPDINITLFAPTNNAFIAAGVNPFSEDFTNIVARPILQYHAISGDSLSDQLAEGYYKSIQGTEFQVLLDPVRIVDATGEIANIVTPDIQTTNGVIHKIDFILTRPSRTVEELFNDQALTGDRFAQFKFALNITGNADAITGSSVNLFAPTDQAFLDLFQELGVTGFPDIADTTLNQIVRYHIKRGGDREFLYDLDDGDKVSMFNGQDITIHKINGAGSPVSIEDLEPDNTDANVTLQDQQATNGILHVIDKVLIPYNL